MRLDQTRASKTVGVAIALAMLTSLVPLGAVSAGSAESPSPTPRLEPTPPPSPELPGHWTKVPKAPWGTAYPATVVVDGDMVVMDRFTGRVLLYDFESRTWERRARLPKRITMIDPWVWTGDELVVFDAFKADRNFAYDPAKDAWRRLPASPLSGHSIAAWADGRLVVAHVEQEDDMDISRSLAVFDLADETWSELPSPVGPNRLVDLIWTGSEVLAVTLDEYEDLVQVASLDLDSEAWSEPVTGPVGWFWAHPVWTGDRLVFSGDGQLLGPADASFDPATMTWAAEDFDCPVNTAAALWTGELLVGTNYNYALDPTTGDCYRVPGRDRTMGGSAAAVWTGDRVIYWSGGGAEEGQPNPYRRNGHAFVFDESVVDEGG